MPLVKTHPRDAPASSEDGKYGGGYVLRLTVVSEHGYPKIQMNTQPQEKQLLYSHPS